jgi:hypothetical protein
MSSKVKLPEASVVVVRLTAVPAASVPVSTKVTAEIGESVPSVTPFALRSKNTAPESFAVGLPKLLPVLLPAAGIVIPVRGVVGAVP